MLSGVESILQQFIDVFPFDDLYRILFFPEKSCQRVAEKDIPLVFQVVDIDDGINKAAIIRHSKKAYVVAEARKLSTDGNYNYTTLDTLSGLITDTLPAQDIQEAADSYGVEIILP